MKIKTNNKDFKPIDVILTVESIQELRLLYHVFNRSLLKDAIFSEHYANENYSQDIANDIGGDRHVILNEITSQGYKL